MADEIQEEKQVKPPFEAHPDIEGAWLDRREKWCKKHWNKNSERGCIAELMMCMVERIRYDAGEIKRLREALGEKR